MRFYGRREELIKIRSYIDGDNTDESNILVISGRRRIGKTRLSLEAVKNTNHLYFFVTRKKETDLLSDWSFQIKEKLGDVFWGDLRNLDDLLKFLFQYSKLNPLTVIFDEFQNFFYTNPAAYSIFQKYFDQYKFESKLFLIFSGSSFSMMEKIFKGSKEPLFGRCNDILNLSYLSLNSQKEFMKEQGIENFKEAVFSFSIFDGIPKYMEDIQKYKEKTFSGRLTKLLKEKDWIWEEGENILKEEFGKEYTGYFSVLSAISKGRRIIDEIKQFTGIKEVGSYIKKLERDYNLIERRLPVTEKRRKSKKGRYYLKDNFIEFWFGHIEANKYLREIGQIDLGIQKIIDSIFNFSGKKFEKMIIRKIIEENPIELKFSRIGNYWDRKGEVEIDIIAINDFENEAYFFEAKINKNKINKKVISKLISNSLKIVELENYKKYYYSVTPEINGITFTKIENQ